MPRTKDQVSRNVGGNANRDSNGDKQNSRRAAATPSRKDAYMGAMSKPAKTRSAMSASDPKSKPQPSKLAPTSSPRTPRSPQAGKMPAVSLPKVFGGGMTKPVSKVAPTKSPRPERRPSEPGFSFRVPGPSQAPESSPPATKSKLAPTVGTRSKANPRRKQKTYPGRTPYNYAV